MIILVLIDTWWNVNKMFLQDSSGKDLCFNRYMVECEFFPSCG